MRWCRWAAVAMLAAGCQSNPYRPTLFQRFRNEPPAGPSLGTPTEGPYLGGEMPAGSYPPPGVNTYPGPGYGPGMTPGYPQGYPPGGVPSYGPPATQTPPVQSFPPAPPPQAPQGPPPRTAPTSR